MLSKTEKKVRKILTEAARGLKDTHHFRKITYKELWLSIYPDGNWGQGCTREVVEWIVNISNKDTKQGLPPLNSIVVRKDTGQPGEDWDQWNNGIDSPFESFAHAQAACWAYWPERSIVRQYFRN